MARRKDGGKDTKDEKDGRDPPSLLRSYGAAGPDAESAKRYGVAGEQDGREEDRRGRQPSRNRYGRTGRAHKP